MPVSPRFAPSRILRRRSTSGRSANFRAIAVPPAKSMPNFRPFCTKIANTPTRISAQEAKIAHHLYLRKSMLVWRNSSMARSSDRQGVDVLAPSVDDVEQRVRNEDGGEDGNEQADDERYGEPFDGSGAELEQEHRGDDDGQVRVDDGREGLREAVLDRRARSAAAPQLFADPLEDQHVRVDRHANGEDEAGNAGQRQGRSEERHGAQQQQRVQDQREH